MKVLIVEDEILAAVRLEKLLLNSSHDIQVLAKLDTIKRTIEWLEEETNPDLIFMDIQLADGLCFDIFDMVQVKCPVIFTTSYDQYAIRAFKVNSIDYLLKPLDPGELYNAINKYDFLAKSYTEKSSPESGALQEAIQMLKQKSFKERFMVKVGEHIKSINVNEIDHFISLEKATFAHTTDNKKFLLDYTLDQLMDMIDPRRFFRINRKYIISIDGFTDIISYSTNRLKIHLKNKSTMDAIVSRERVQDFKKWLDR
ncbi:MAG: response regulator transcription factor [Cyclobacteriaceae bacterium]|nr:response regulator transcription factor [Cyclobacteriaceae bacterium]MCK5371194.1 response regulator transcription factor [Cyclobacteriaceae bacterium]MCK5467503.1 response regulator transcription factor [Cyclobacteriaceae bacterium]